MKAMIAMQTHYLLRGVVGNVCMVLMCVAAVRCAEASFPASFNLSDLNGLNGFALTGIDLGDAAGYSVSGGGDINGDGVDDILIGAGGGDPRGNDRAGESYIVFGIRGQFPASVPIGQLLNGRDGFVLNGAEAGDLSGSSISFAGDFNDDGVDDLIVGSPGGDPLGRTYAGTSHIVFGRAGGFPTRLELRDLTADVGLTLHGSRRLDEMGISVSSAGDVNGDGIDDLIIGGSSANTELLSAAGKTFVVLGRTNNIDSVFDLANLDGNNGFVITGANDDDRSGHSVSSAGDFNGDGIGDFIIGAPDAAFPGRPTAGASYLIYGRADGFPSSIDLDDIDGQNGFAIIGTEGKSGYSVSEAGDFNGDGFSDLVIGAYNATGGGNFAGESYVLFGTSETFASTFHLASLDGVGGFRMTGETNWDQIGRSVGSAGDLNDDGFDDIVIGAPYAGPSSRPGAGKSYVVFGSGDAFPQTLSLSDLDGSNGFVLSGISIDDLTGWSVSSAGDFNGDGVSDLIIGAPGASFGTGAAYIVFGQRAIPEPHTSALLGMLVSCVATVSRRHSR